jgi:hypothetical protein
MRERKEEYVDRSLKNEIDRERMRDKEEGPYRANKKRDRKRMREKEGGRQQTIEREGENKF